MLVSRGGLESRGEGNGIFRNKISFSIFFIEITDEAHNRYFLKAELTDCVILIILLRLDD